MRSSNFILRKRDTCAVCTNIAPCPVCPKGQECQQIFRSSCQDCPVNKCVAIPGYDAGGGTNKSALGGGLAVMFIVMAAAVAFWFWRRLKAKRRRIALHEDAMERREKVRSEKEATTLQLGAKEFVVGEEEMDGDTEYTQVTGVLNDQDALGMGEQNAFRRRSFGAATHLSRITEGVEEEEDERRNTIGSLQSSFTGPRISVGSGTSLGSHNVIPIAFRPPPSPSAVSAGQNSDETPLALPTTAHRATGAPTLQVNSARQGPIRPTRAPDLNLRLPDSHKPATSSPLAASTGDSQPAYEFMSIDPVEALKSGPYRADRPLSSATVNSTHSGSLSYVLSAPQVITPVSAEGVRRVQVGNGGKAQLVKVPSLKRKDQASSNRVQAEREASNPFSDPLEAEEQLVSPPAARFADANTGRNSTMSTTSTLGIPFGANPFGEVISGPTDQSSPSDAVERSSWLGSSHHVSHTGGAERSADPFQDPAMPEAENTDATRASIGGLSLLADFPFAIQGQPQLPEDARERVDRFK